MYQLIDDGDDSGFVAGRGRAKVSTGRSQWFAVVVVVAKAPVVRRRTAVVSHSTPVPNGTLSWCRFFFSSVYDHCSFLSFSLPVEAVYCCSCYCSRACRNN
jgi:hypothetical protein